MYASNLFDKGYMREFWSTHARKSSGTNRAILNKVSNYLDVVSPDNPNDLKDRKPEYQIEVYENKDLNFGLKREEYDQEQDVSQVHFHTPVPIEHMHMEKAEPQLKEYDPEIDRVMVEHAIFDIFGNRDSAVAETDDLNEGEIVNEAVILEALYPEGDTISSSIDDILDDDIVEDLSLDVLIDEIMGEPPMQEEQEDVPPELMENEMPY